MSRHRHRVLLAILCCALLPAGAARAATVSTAIKTATPLPPGGAAAITASIGANIKALSDPKTTKVGRQALVADADTPAGGATPAYQSAYIAALVPAIQPLLNDKDQLVRLNAAIVVGSVAQAVERNDVADLLVPLVKVMLQSKEPAVQYWGMKTAKYALLATAVKANKDGGLGAVIVNAVQKSSDPSLLIEEAYSGLTFDSLRGAAGAGGPRTQGALAPVSLPFILDLLEWRVGLYKAGMPPGIPEAESIATGFLPVTAWAAVSANPQTQKRTLTVVGELTCNQLNVIQKAGGSADPEMVDAAKGSGSAIGAFGRQLAKAPGSPLETAGTTISKNLAPNTPPDRVGTMCKSVIDGLQAVGVTINMP